MSPPVRPEGEFRSAQHEGSPVTTAAGRAGVGVRTPLIDGVDKVTGRARYTADLPLGPA